MKLPVWTKGRVQKLAGASTTATARVVDRFTDSTVALGDARAWGQYLDEDHYSTNQWGLYGTSAGAQTLALKVRITQATHKPSKERLIELSSPLLPKDLAQLNDRLADKKSKGDFDNPLKLAFVAEALCPDEEYVSEEDTPPLVHALIARAVDERAWSSRPATDETAQTKDRFFPSAYIVHALRRYEAFETSPVSARARDYLAQAVLTDQAVRTPSMLALIGLALLPLCPDPTRPQRVSEALERCEQELVAWVKEQKHVIIDRPVFHGFSLGTRTDYIFLHPEVLAALFFLRYGNPPPARRFVLRVIDSLTRNIDQARGFAGQNRVISSVDQLWAVRLLHEFLERQRSPNAQQALLPPMDLRLTFATPSARRLAIAALVSFILGCALLARGKVVPGLATGAVAILTTVLGLLVARKD